MLPIASHNGSPTTISILMSLSRLLFSTTRSSIIARISSWSNAHGSSCICFFSRICGRGQGRLWRLQIRVPHGASLSLPPMPQFGFHTSFDHFRGQAACILPHISPSIPLPKDRHETLWAMNLYPSISMLGSVHSSRNFATHLGKVTDKTSNNGIGDDGDGCSYDGGDVSSDESHDGVVDEAGEDNDKKREHVKEVDRVYKVVEELFASDGNMEAVLGQCNVNLSHRLVVDVLNRFRHARKPASKFFYWAGQQPGFFHDSQTYNAMMSILGKTRQFESMLEMLEEMGKKDLINIEAFVLAIKAFAAGREMKKAIGMFELMKKYKFEADIGTVNTLLDALGRAKLAKEAQTFFEKISDRFAPDLKTYSVLLSGWCKVKNLVESGKIWNKMVEKGVKPDIVAHNTMLEGLFLGGRKSEAIKLFELMKAKGPSPNVRSYTILIRDLCKRKKMREALQYFDEMQASGCKPDVAVYTCLIVGFGNAGKMFDVYGLLQEMKKNGCPPDGRTYNALIKLMTNRNMPGDAATIYNKMLQNGLEPTLHTYNMLMKSFFLSKNYDMGLNVWNEMLKKGCCPDDNSYTVFINGLIRTGRSQEASHYIEEMINKGMKAPRLDYNKFAADFSRAGKPDILEDLGKKFKFSGKFDDSNTFLRLSAQMKKRVRRREP